jgi:hypothetical protein
VESDFFSSRLVFESAGWLAAHKKSRSCFKHSPVNFHRNSISGELSSAPQSDRGAPEWRTWGLRLFQDHSPGHDTEDL